MAQSGNISYGSITMAGTITGTGSPFKIGDAVKLRPGTRYYHQAPERVGQITSSSTQFGYQWHVDWGQPYGDANYDTLDLELVKDSEAIKKPVIKPKITLESVILSAEKKEQINAAISQSDNHEKIFTDWGFSEVLEKGKAITLLFWGIPGTGKTLMAQAIAETLGRKLKIYTTAEIETAEPGGAERNIKEIFSASSRAKDTVVLLFDECDSLLFDRGEVGVIMASQVNCLLGEIENYEGIIIFTTNRLGKLDPALNRRISAKIEFPFPDVEARKQIWLRMIPKKAPLGKNIDFGILASYSLTGGYIKNAVLSAARMAAYKKCKQIEMAHFVDAVEKEKQAQDDFIREYENEVHQNNLGGKQRERGKLSLQPEQIQRKLLDIYSINDTK